MSVRRLLFIIMVCAIGVLAITYRHQMSSGILPVQRRILRFFHSSLCYQCNVIVVSIDGLSERDLPCYDYAKQTAPNLCGFAERHIQFINAYSNSSVSTSSEFSLFTSLYPSMHAMHQDNAFALSPSIVTLPEQMKRHGYATIYSGFTDDAYAPFAKGLNRGFDTFVSADDSDRLETSLEMFRKSVQHGARTFLYLQTHAVGAPYLPGHHDVRMFASDVFPGIPLAPEDFFRVYPDFSRYVMDELDDYFRRLDPAARKTSGSVRDRSIYDQMLENRDPVVVQRLLHQLSGSLRLAILKKRWVASFDERNPDMIAYMRALYDERIAQLDTRLPSLFSLADDPDFRQNTIIVVTASHGEEFLEHGAIQHGDHLYDTSIHVPLIMSVPGTVPKKIGDLTQSIDLYPTLMGLIGIRPDAQLRGLDMTDVLGLKLNGKQNFFVISESGPGGIRTIRTSQWKLFVGDGPEGAVQHVYDMLRDPGERMDLVGTYPELEQYLLSVLRSEFHNQM